MNIHAFPDDILVAEAAKALNAEFASHRGRDFLFLSSGGSSLALLDSLDASLFGPRSMVAVLDERYSSDPAVNNFAQLAKTRFYEQALANGCVFVDTRPKEGESMEDVATRFEAALRDWKEKTNGIIIATVGVGPDAHTSGIMPYPEDSAFFETSFNDPRRWIKAYNAGKKSVYPLRITATLPLIRKIDFALSFIRGGDKRDAVKRLRADRGALNESPCRILRELYRVEIFTSSSFL